MYKCKCYCILLVVQLLFNQVYCNQRICMQLENVNTEQTYPIPSQQGPQGPPGKRGPPGNVGPAGLQGPRGHQEHVDYDRINAVIESAISKIQLDMIEMNETIAKIQQQTEVTPNCEVSYKKTCYWLELREAEMNFEEAKQACIEMGMYIGYIEDETHYEKIEQLVRTKSTLSMTGYWTGLVYKNSRVVTISGNSSPFVKWYPGRPASDTQHSNIYIYVRKDTGDANHGMYNYLPTYKQPGVICQRNLPA